MYHALPKDALYSAYRLFVDFYPPHGGETKTVSGTCFFIRSRERLVLVTNRHNLDLTCEAQKYVGYKRGGLKISGYFGGNLLQHEVAFEIDAVFPDDSSEDVAIIPGKSNGMFWALRTSAKN